MLGDRVSLLFEARSQAMKLLHKRPDDRQNYRLLCEVGLSLLRLNGNKMVLSEGIDALRVADRDRPHPEFTADRKHYEQLLLHRVKLSVKCKARSRLASASTASGA